jgi:hypothetical protein
MLLIVNSEKDGNWGHGGNRNAFPSSLLRNQQKSEIRIEISATKYLVFINGQLQVIMNQTLSSCFLDDRWDFKTT